MSLAVARLGLTAAPPRDAAVVARLTELIGPTVFELAVADLAGGFLASFDAITLYLDLSGDERSAYASLSCVFISAYAAFRQRAPRLPGPTSPARPPALTDGRRALAAWRQARRLLAFTRAKRQALCSLLGHHRHARVLIFTAGQRHGVRHRARSTSSCLSPATSGAGSATPFSSASAEARSGRSCRPACSTKASTCPTRTSL